MNLRGNEMKIKLAPGLVNAPIIILAINSPPGGGMGRERRRLTRHPLSLPHQEGKKMVSVTSLEDDTCPSVA
jgi:hypothetical protein